MKSADNLTNADLFCLVPAGGMGSRLGCLTTEQAKPSLAVSFTDDGEIVRMIDIPLQAIRKMGGTALVSTLYAPESLEFVNQYVGVRTFHETAPGTPIDTLAANIQLLRKSKASIIGIVPGDALVEETMLLEMKRALQNSGADAAILSTRKLEGHNVRPVDKHSFVTGADKATDSIADLGVHFMRKDWLLDRLTQQILSGKESIDIWADMYGITEPAADILLYVPENDPEHIDMGTPENFHKAVYLLNRVAADDNDNVLFPEARISYASSRTIALPRSAAACALNTAIIPEGRSILHENEALRGERAA